jgi:pyrroloquinoline quinone biosynthesis protein B
LDPALVGRRAVALEEPFAPVEELQVVAFAVPGKVALYLEGDDPDTTAMGEQTVGLRVSDGRSRFYYIPGCAELPDGLVSRVADADLLLFDGTVWADDEMPTSGTGTKTGRRMGHLAMQGPQDSLARLGSLRGCRKVYIHINNTNSVLQPDGPERAAVSAAGWEIAADGMEVRL